MARLTIDGTAYGPLSGPRSSAPVRRETEAERVATYAYIYADEAKAWRRERTARLLDSRGKHDLAANLRGVNGKVN